MLIKIILFIQILSYNKNIMIKFQFSNIILRIKGTGTKNVFTSRIDYFDSKYYPNIVYINDEKQNIVNHSYNFD